MMKHERARVVCMWVGWVMLAVTLGVIPFVVSVGVHVPACTSFLALGCALLGKKSVLLRVLSALVFAVVGIGSVVPVCYAFIPRIHTVRDLSSAISSRDPKVVSRKIDAGCNVNGKGLHGHTMLTIACTFPSPRETADPRELAKVAYDIIDLLLEHGAAKTLNEIDTYGGKAPIHYLALPSYYYPEDQVKLMTLVISKGADVNLKDKKGMTPLHIAVRYGAPTEVITALVTNGADVNATDADGKTPLQNAVEQGKTDIAEYLRQHGGANGDSLF